MYFNPTNIRFVAQDYLGAPIVGMNVTAVGVESSLGSLDWIPFLFGINLNNTPMLNTTMYATTGTDGAVVFSMIEAEKYELHYVDTALNIDEKRYYYPSQSQYLETFWTESVVLVTPTPAPCGAPYFYANATLNSTNVFDLVLNFSDCSASIANMTFYVSDVSFNKVKHVIYSNQTLNPNLINMTYVLPIQQGGSYRFGITGRTTTNRPVYQESLLSINASRWQANFLQASDNDPVAYWFYNALAVALISIFGYIFSRSSMKAGVAVVPLIGAAFYFMGWLQTTPLLVSVAVVLGVAFYLRYAEQEARL
jgi:hypothetical protein